MQQHQEKQLKTVHTILGISSQQLTTAKKKKKVVSGEATNRNCEAGQGLQRFLLRALHQHGLVPTALHLPRRTQRQKGAQTFT